MTPFTVELTFIPDDVADGLVAAVGLAVAGALCPAEQLRLVDGTPRRRALRYGIQALNSAEAHRTAEVIRGAIRPLVAHVYEPIVREV